MNRFTIRDGLCLGVGWWIDRDKICRMQQEREQMTKQVDDLKSPVGNLQNENEFVIELLEQCRSK